MSKQPLVSIIVPTKNSAAVLDACLESITKQTYKNIELIVVDNFSTDDTQKIAKKYTKHVFAKGPERSTQRNYGVKKSKGEYVVIIDSDMELSPKVIDSCVELVQKNPEIEAVKIPEESFGKGFWAQCKKLERSFYLNVPWIEGSRFFTKRVYEKVGGFDENMISGEDWDLSQRVEKETQVGRINEFIYHNEGHLKLIPMLKKKYYYAQHFSKYKSKTDSQNIGNQTSVFKRYGLFFSKPGKLFKNPLLGIGMLGMKTSEFFVGGIGLIRARGRIE